MRSTASTSTSTDMAERQERRQQHRNRNRRSASSMQRSLAFFAMAAMAATGSTTTSAIPMVLTAEATANPAVSAAIGALKAMDYRYFVAGGTCAAFSHGITTPIDVVKTKIQANPEKFKGKGLAAATLQIVRDGKDGNGGVATLLTGLGPTVFGYGIEGAMKFGVYEVAKPVFAALLGDENKFYSFVMASFLAGSVAAVLLVPMESLRIKQVTNPSYENDTLLTGLPRIFRDDGFWVTMSGVWAMLAKQVPYTFGKQVSFDLVAKFLYSVVLVRFASESMAGSPQSKWIVSLLSAFCASIVACLCSQPGDMILTETYNKGTLTETKKRSAKTTPITSSGSSTPGRFGTVVQTINERGGLAEFFRGTEARLVHVGLIITSQLVVYDLVKQLLGLPATGSH